MKICIVGPSYPYRGGIAHYTALLAEALAVEHRVSVYTFRRMYPRLFFPGASQYDESEHPFKTPASRTLDSLLPWTWRATGRAIASQQPDAVLFQWWHPFFAPSYAGVASWLRRHHCTARILFLCHNVVPHERTWIDRALLPRVYRYADGFVCHSRADAEEIRHLGLPAPSIVVAHPTYEAFRRHQPDRDSAKKELGLDGPTLLFFGYVRPYKGLRYFLESLPLVFAERSDATALVVGEFYEDRAEYDHLIERLGIAGRVRIIDEYVPNEAVGLYFSACDLVVQPYTSATQSGVTQVAFGFQRPVVVTRVGGLPEVVEDGVTGLLVPPESSEEIARAVLQFFSDDMAERMERAIAERASHFGWDRLVDSLARLVDEITREA
jgi:glycosyltransferase involved in cell wall biosynthesis